MTIAGKRGELPVLTPPIAEGVRPEGMPAAPPVMGEANASSEVQSRPNFFRRHIGKIGVGAAVVIIGAGAVLGNALNNGNDSDSAANGDKITATAANSGPGEDACPEGIFSAENPFAAEEDVKPGQLYRSPVKELKNKSDLYNYFMGNESLKIDGELCMLPSGLATQEMIMNGWVGEGSAGARPFKNPIQDANELAKFYAANPAEAQTTLDDNKFQSFIDSYELNEKAIDAGAYFQLMLKDGKIVQQPVQLGKMNPGDVYELSGNVWFGDSKFSSSQVALIDMNGNQYVLQSIGGAEIIAPDTTTTTAPAAPQEGAEQPGDQSNNNGGEGQTGINGSAGPNGQNPEAGPDGVTNSPAQGNTPSAGSVPDTVVRPGNPGNPGGGTPTTEKPYVPPTPTTTEKPYVPPTPTTVEPWKPPVTGCDQAIDDCN